MSEVSECALWFGEAIEGSNPCVKISTPDRYCGFILDLSVQITRANYLYISIERESS